MAADAPLFAEALAIRTTALGERHSAVAEVLGNQGALAFARGRYVEADYQGTSLEFDADAKLEMILGPGHGRPL